MGKTQETLMFKLNAIDHVGIKVTDLDQSLDFYQRLGFTLLRTSAPNAEGLRIAVIQIGSQELNLISHPDFVSSGEENPVGMDHFCLAVDAPSVADVIADLRQAGIDVVRGPVQRRDGIALFVHDPDRVHVELQLKNPSTT